MIQLLATRRHTCMQFKPNAGTVATGRPATRRYRWFELYPDGRLATVEPSGRPPDRWDSPRRGSGRNGYSGLCALMNNKDDLVRHYHWLRQPDMDSHSGNASVGDGEAFWDHPTGCCADGGSGELVEMSAGWRHRQRCDPWTPGPSGDLSSQSGSAAGPYSMACV